MAIRPDGVAIYIRWSTDEQGHGTTRDVQLEACRHLILSRGWQVREDLVFVDEGHSGATLQRPAMERLRQRVQAGEVDAVVVYKLDRLTRSLLDAVDLVWREWRDRCELLSAREPIDTTTPLGKLLFAILATFAEHERETIRERMWAGRLKRASAGRSPGFPVPYGYRKGSAPGLLEPHPEEAPVVQLIFRLREGGIGQGPLSVRQIATYLNNCGYPAKRGGRWHPSAVAKVLSNPLYTGRLIWGRNRGELGEGPARIDTVAQIPPLVSTEQYARVQALAAAGRRRRQAAKRPFLLAGLLRCGRCGGPMVGNRCGRWSYYRCARRVREKSCLAPSVPAEPLEQAVLARLDARFGAAAGQLAAELARQAVEQERAQRQAELDRLRRHWERLGAASERIDADYRRGELSGAERRQLLEQLDEERQQLARQIEGLSSGLAVPTLDVGPCPPEGWWRGAQQELRPALWLLLDSAKVDKEGDTCHLTLRWCA